MTATAPAVEGDAQPDVLTVQQLSGHELIVQTRDEQAFYKALQQGLLKDSVFTEASDMADLDRLMSYELQVFRANQWVAAGCDYDGRHLGLSHLTEMRRQAKELAALIREVKTDLGLSRAARSAEAAESVGSYLVELKKHAKEQGIKKNDEVRKALQLTHELISLVGTFDRANDTERQKLGIETEADVVEWLRVRFIPEFQEIDKRYRATSQKFWVGTL